MEKVQIAPCGECALTDDASEHVVSYTGYTPGKYENGKNKR